MKWLSENMEKQYGMRVLFSRQGESGVLAEETRAFLFCAIRELLVNVVKHADASQVAVRLRWCANSVEILVADNGKGFQPGGTFGLSLSQGGVPESQDGFGLFNIQERVSDLGGRLRMRSEPFKGTAVKIDLPLDTSVLPLDALVGQPFLAADAFQAASGPFSDVPRQATDLPQE